jgi:hypothetical protein
LLGCDAPPLSEREAEVASVLARADDPLLRSRPGLVAAKYRLMAEDPYAFLRGSLALYRHDLSTNHGHVAESAYGLSAPMPLSLGDPHVENFGLLEATDGTLALEPNDFDAAERFPYLWDLRRLTISLSLTVRLVALAGGTSAQPVDVAAAAARAYATDIRALAGGAPRTRLSDPSGDVVLADLFERGLEDLESRSELAELTVEGPDGRRLRRGPLDPTDPDDALESLPECLSGALPTLLADYAASLATSPPASELTVLDAARLRGSGVASYPRVRALVLLRGATDASNDDWILELKELGEAPDSGLVPPYGHFADIPSRVLDMAHSAWARPDAEPRWGGAPALGLPFQLRRESEAHKGLRVTRLEGERATPEAFSVLAAHLGSRLAVVHAAELSDSPVGAASEIARVVGADVEAFAAEQGAISASYAAILEEDATRFGAVLDALGPTLGVLPESPDEISPDLRALYGDIPLPE